MQQQRPQRQQQQQQRQRQRQQQRQRQRQRQRQQRQQRQLQQQQVLETRDLSDKQQLLALGFSEFACTVSLTATGGNFEAARGRLLYERLEAKIAAVQHADKLEKRATTQAAILFGTPGCEIDHAQAFGAAIVQQELETRRSQELEQQEQRQQEQWQQEQRQQEQRQKQQQQQQQQRQQKGQQLQQPQRQQRQQQQRQQKEKEEQQQQPQRQQQQRQESEQQHQQNDMTDAIQASPQSSHEMQFFACAAVEEALAVSLRTRINELLTTFPSPPRIYYDDEGNERAANSPSMNEKMFGQWVLSM